MLPPHPRSVLQPGCRVWVRVKNYWKGDELSYSAGTDESGVKGSCDPALKVAIEEYVPGDHAKIKVYVWYNTILAEN